MKNGNNRPCLLIIIPFKIYLQSFPIQKLFIFVNENENGFHSINVEKVLDQTMPTIIHVSWSKLLGARVAMVRYQQELWRKFTSTEQM